MNKATCLSIDLSTSACGMQLQGGPTVTAYPINEWPAVGGIYWVEDLGNGSWIVVGNLTKTTGWNSYTPSWQCVAGSPTTQPSVGNGVLLGRWRRHGSTVTVGIFASFGSTTNGGQGSYQFGLPFLPSTVLTEQWCGVCKVFSNTGAQNFFGPVQVFPGSLTNCVAWFPRSDTASGLGSVPFRNSLTGAVGQGVPLIAGAFTCSNGANYSLGFTYECA